MATTETFVPGRLYEMSLADLQPDPNQPRKYLDPAALDEFTEDNPGASAMSDYANMLESIRGLYKAKLQKRWKRYLIFRACWDRL